MTWQQGMEVGDSAGVGEIGWMYNQVDLRGSGEDSALIWQRLLDFIMHRATIVSLSYEKGRRSHWTPHELQTKGKEHPFPGSSS